MGLETPCKWTEIKEGNGEKATPKTEKEEPENEQMNEFKTTARTER